MRYVRLGGTNLNVSAFCLGTMMFGGRADADESERIVGAAIDAGVNFIDAADIYTGGESERIVGRAIASRRDELVLASKVAMKVGEGPNDIGVSRWHIVRGVEASLKRLATDRLDVLYIHWPSAGMNLREMLRATDDLVRAGKVLYVGCSNFPAWLLVRCLWVAEANGFDPIVVGQYPYNLIERGVEVELLPAAAAMKVGITVYRCLAVGLLTGKYLAETPPASRGEEDKRIIRWGAAYRDGVAGLVKIAERRGCTPADLAVNWALSHPVVTAAIVGVSRLAQLEANLAGFQDPLSGEERQEITGLFDTEVWEEVGGGFPKWRRSFDIIR